MLQVAPAGSVSSGFTAGKVSENAVEVGHGAEFGLDAVEEFFPFAGGLGGIDWSDAFHDFVV